MVADPRGGTHGHEPAAAERTRLGKERLFAEAVRLLDPYARRRAAIPAVCRPKP